MKMIAPETLDITSLPSLLIADRKRMPNIAACYLVLEEESVIYIGQSSSLVIRWLSHNKLKELRARKTEIRVAWIEVSEPRILPIIEKALIQYFKPVLNRVLIREPKPKELSAPKKGQQPKQLEKYTEALVARNDKGLGTKHGQKPISVMLPPELDNWVRSLDNRSEWIRQAIAEKLEREQQSA